jgi:thiamine-phosphate pyrophosphorylase
MDRKLVGWARAVKARQRERAGKVVPPLWLFTDQVRVPDTVAAVRRLPVGLAGVVLRDGGTGAEMRARQIAVVCRQRRLWLSIGGDAGPPGMLHTGVHLRAGYRKAGVSAAFLTSSAHDAADMRRAARAGAAVIFLSPVFPTLSHPGALMLGVRRWSALARSARAGALGGVDGRTVRRLPKWCRYVGAIGALTG